ncbi:GNAT family N-acetyltransferase [Polaromonas sp.]|uniref:GNAT family N-acetyltransferase n=1 Tax=Polaromonas sp. TaxID=1869339 RepID=UPI00286ADFEA|nr:GNAT family N-acetyltransferase [Polaromonas sp.]
MSIGVSIEDFNSSQFEQLAALFASYFPAGDKLLSRDYTEWLYAKNPYGPAKMVKAVDDGRLVGFMAMIPVHLVRRDARLVAYYVVNVLVHPEYHGKHVFGRMITAAKELVKTENAVLMGHPNDMALKSWQRARMHFHASLKPSLALPRLRARGARAHVVGAVSQLQSVLAALNAQALQADRWNIAVTGDYVSWRYLAHPANKYLVQLIEVHGAAAGFLVSKKVRPGIRLLVDQFMLDPYAAGSLGRLPWLTISFRPEASASEFAGSLWPIPVKKQIPFFFTHYAQPSTARDVMNLGLSASDF